MVDFSEAKWPQQNITIFEKNDKLLNYLHVLKFDEKNGYLQLALTVTDNKRFPHFSRQEPNHKNKVTRYFAEKARF